MNIVMWVPFIVTRSHTIDEPWKPVILPSLGSRRILSRSKQLNKSTIKAGIILVIVFCASVNTRWFTSFTWSTDDSWRNIRNSFNHTPNVDVRILLLTLPTKSITFRFTDLSADGCLSCFLLLLTRTFYSD